MADSEFSTAELHTSLVKWVSPFHYLIETICCILCLHVHVPKSYNVVGELPCSWWYFNV